MLQSPCERQIRRRRGATQELTGSIVRSKRVVEPADHIERDGIARKRRCAEAAITDALGKIDGSFRRVQPHVGIAGEPGNAGVESRCHFKMVVLANALQRPLEPTTTLFGKSIPIEELRYAARYLTAEHELVRRIAPEQRGANILQVSE